MKTRKLYRGSEYIIVDEGSAREAALVREGWELEPPKPKSAKGDKKPGKDDGGKPAEPGQDEGDGNLLPWSFRTP